MNKVNIEYITQADIVYIQFSSIIYLIFEIKNIMDSLGIISSDQVAKLVITQYFGLSNPKN